MDWNALWIRFRKSVWFRFSYLMLIVAMASLLLPSALGCLGLILIPVLILLVPISFGERRMRNHLVNGAFALLMIPVVLTLFLAPSLSSIPEVSRDGLSVRADLTQGMVTPFRTDSPETLFRFSVNVTTDDPSNSSFEVRVQVIDYDGLGFASGGTPVMLPTGDRDLRNGEIFQANLTLTPRLHGFYFLVAQPNGTSETIIVQTPPVNGPFNISEETYRTIVLASSYLSMVVVAMGFFLFLLLYWWTRRARDLRGGRAPPEKKRAEGGGEFTCTNCGADVSEEDTKCPKCGAAFESEAQGEPAEADA